MSNLISRSALIKDLAREYATGRKTLGQVIDEQPTIEAEPVVHGEILWNDDVPHCSVCKKVIHGASAYCNHCGAKMKGAE